MAYIIAVHYHVSMYVSSRGLRYHASMYVSSRGLYYCSALPRLYVCELSWLALPRLYVCELSWLALPRLYVCELSWLLILQCISTSALFHVQMNTASIISHNICLTPLWTPPTCLYPHYISDIRANAKFWAIVGLLLGKHLRCWPNSKPTLFQYRLCSLK